MIRDRYDSSTAQSLHTHEASIPACLPLQFCRIDAGPHRRARRVSAGHVEREVGRVGQRASVSPAPSRIALAVAMCVGVPSWLAHTSASCPGGRRSPARTIASACIGLFAERG